MAIGCAANWLRNRTLHCAITGPLFLIAALVFLMSNVTQTDVNIGHSLLLESASRFYWNGGIRGFLRRSFEVSSRAAGHAGIVGAAGVVPANVQILADGRPASIREIVRAINGR